jgi:invasion protein IalB
MAVFSVGSALCGSAAAQDVELKDKFGIWSLYCAKSAAPPKYDDCSITAGVHAKDNPDLWTKVAIAAASPYGDLAMTVRTPLLKYLRTGISLGFDGRQAGRGIIDTCSVTSCESTIALDDRLIVQLSIGDKMTIDYQVAADKGALLVLELDQMAKALGALGTNSVLAFIGGSQQGQFAGMADVRTFVLERRKFDSAVDSNAAATVAWKAPLLKCIGLPAKKTVMVMSDFTVQNEEDVADWAVKSSKCSDEGAVWIRQKNAGSDDSAASLPLHHARLGSLTVYNTVSKFMPTGLVPDDGSQVAIVPQTMGSVLAPVVSGIIP